MLEVVEAIYENGVFKPLTAPKITEGIHVKLTVESALEAAIEELLELAGQVYDGLSDSEIAEIENWLR